MVTVKRIAGGLFSNWAGDNLKAGERVAVMPPHGSFTVPFAPENRKRYVAFAGGSGITPIMSLIKTALSVEPESRFTLFYGNRDSRSIIFLEALVEDDHLEIFALLEEVNSLGRNRITNQNFHFQRPVIMGTHPPNIN